MSAILLGIVILALLFLAAKAFIGADPRQLVPLVKRAGGVGVLCFSALFAVRGQFAVAVPLGMVGLSLLGWLPFGPAGLFQRTQKSPGQASRVRTAAVEMELDHDTGVMRGRMLAGQYEGMMLDALDIKKLVGLLADLDEESRALLMAYLDRRQPTWRDDMQADTAAGHVNSSWDSGKMTDEEAYQILGVQPGASADEIGHAHRALMKKLHPDQGGSTYLAARVNQAKDVLLRRHL
jgi:DnaJ domain